MFRAVPVFALVFATAVLFPLSRAHLGFQDRAAVTVSAAATRPALRRRFGPQRLGAQHARLVQLRVAPVAGDARTAGGTLRPARQAVDASASDALRVGRQAGPSVSAHRHGPSGSNQPGQRIIDPVAPSFHAERPCGSTPSARTIVATQSVGDVPEPPPKPAAL
jgi:hypothetical protein